MCVCVCACVSVSVCVLLQSCLTFCYLWAGPLFMGFSRQEYWSGLPIPPPGNLPDPGIEPTSPGASALHSLPHATKEAICVYIYIYMCVCVCVCVCVCITESFCCIPKTNTTFCKSTTLQ